MMKLKQIFQAFGHDPKWARFATASTVPMSTVFLRKMGDTDITTLTDFDIEMQLAMSEQSEDHKVKARSCMHYLLRWAREQGKEVPQIAHPSDIKEQETKEPADNDNSDRDKVKSATRSKRGQKSDENITKPKQEKLEKVLTKRPTKRGDTQIARRKADTQMTLEDWQADTRYRHGTIEHDTSSKGWKNGKRVFKDCWRAVIMINGQRYRHRGETREECAEWLKAVCAKNILPTDNKADWWRMEQHKDEEARTDELIVSAAEEANIVYEYHQTGDTQILYDYCTKALLPHMVYYCAHTLQLGRDRTLTASRQAVGLILTKIVGGRPVTNITFTCKRMLRTYASRGDFWYYDKAPEEVKLMVNRIDMSALEELYKVTKDRRI